MNCYVYETSRHGGVGVGRDCEPFILIDFHFKGERITGEINQSGQGKINIWDNMNKEGVKKTKAYKLLDGKYAVLREVNKSQMIWIAYEEGKVIA